MEMHIPDEPVYPVQFGSDPFPPEGTQYTPPQFAPDEETLKRMVSSDDEAQPSKE
jgi:hypothetical protein